MKLQKGFYVIGRDLENSKSFNFGTDTKMFSTEEDALKEKEGQEELYQYDNMKVEILEVA